MRQAHSHARSTRGWLAAALIVGTALTGCNDAATPSDPPLDGGAQFDAQLDPAGSSFLLKRIDSPLPGRAFVRVELIGSRVRTDPANETVSIDVAIRNVGDAPLHVPAIVWLHQFEPSTVMPLNSDVRDHGGDPDSSSTPRLRGWGFDYSKFLGEDAILEPGETSGAKTWMFSDPGLVSFSFAAEAHFGMQPDRPHISGAVFHDANRNRQRDRGEGPFGGMVTLTTPGRETFTTIVDANGRYRFPIEVAGLYRLAYASTFRDGEPEPTPMPPEPQPEPRILVCVTTPNPLQVLIPNGPDGQPSSFEHGDFGVVLGACDIPGVPLLALTDLRPEDIEQDPYSLLGGALEGDVLSLRVGFSGCSPDHPFVLYASRGFMESNPVQTWSLLAHNDRDEVCDAWFERTLQFNLAPLRAAHIRAYGEPGVVIVRFRNFRGDETRFEFGP